MTQGWTQLLNGTPILLVGDFRALFQRAIIGLLRLYYRLLNWMAWRKHSKPSQYVDIAIESSGTELTGRIYNDQSESRSPVIIFFHGGGWMLGDLRSHHPFCGQLADKTGSTVISVGYRLAPEHRFPQAHVDCLRAVNWVADRYGNGNRDIVLAGDSAGGNLALCTALEETPSNRRINGVLAIYPITDHYNAGFNSYTERGSGYALTSSLMHTFWDTYLGGLSPEDNQVRRALPLHSRTLDKLPRTMIITAEFDPLRDEGVSMARKLEEHDVETLHCHFNSQHGFACSEGLTDDHVAMMETIERWLMQ